MNKLTRKTLLVLTLAVVPVTAFAQDTTTTDTTTSAATDTTANNDNDQGFDYGWLGLLGLAGLAGLNRKQPPVVHADPQRR